MIKMGLIFQRVTLMGIIAIAGILLLTAAKWDSATFDESAHIPAGYSYVKYLDYRLNHEHPPLVKILSGLPLLFMDLKFPDQSTAWKNDVNGQWAVGGDFFYNLGNDAEKIIFWGRVGPVLLTLLTIFFLYIFALQFMGRWWALLPTALFAFSPIVLAHGHLVTTDIGATFGVLIAFYFFLKFLRTETRAGLLYAGVAFGIAELTKFSNVLIGPVFVLIMLLKTILEIKNSWAATPKENRLRLLAGIAGLNLFYLASLIFIGFIVIYLTYALLIINYPQQMQIRDMHYILDGFSPNFMKEAALWAAGHDTLRPLAQYFFGVFSVLRRAAGGNASFFLGSLSGKGWWYYFPVIYLLKETIPVLLLLLIGFFTLLRRAWQNMKNQLTYLREYYGETSMALFILIYWGNSILSPLNIGVRHILPTIPFLYIFAAMGIRAWVAFPKNNGLIVNFQNITSYALQFSKSSLKFVFIFLLFLWLILEVILIAPFYISYFNEFAGGSSNGYKYATDSNFDWGQDLGRLKNFVDKNNIQKIAVDYFGGGSPGYTLGDKEENWWSARGNPKDQNIEWLAVSVNTLSGALGKLTPGFERRPSDEYGWLKEMRNPFKPDARAGYSIFIYHLQ